MTYNFRLRSSNFAQDFIVTKYSSHFEGKLPFLDVSFVMVTIAVMKHHDPRQLGEERVYLVYMT